MVKLAEQADLPHRAEARTRPVKGLSTAAAVDSQHGHGSTATLAASFSPPAKLSPNQLCGWGRLPQPGYEVFDENLARGSLEVPLSRGLGRSYGDSSLPPADRPIALNTTRADRILAFDRNTGVLRAEAGLSLWELNRLLLHRGWFTPVTPGTQFVTLGGMVAADVHGKNHHVDGCFGQHVTGLRMRLADGRTLDCGPEQQSELFWATVGGMGLTGHILEVAFTMKAIPSPWIWQESRRVPHIEAFLEALEEGARAWPMTVGWIDCVRRGKGMGRGILMAGRWAEVAEAPAKSPRQPSSLAVPFEMPSWLLGKLTVKAFNELYYWKHWPKKRAGIVSPYSFFYPLDALRQWNYLYGRRGFTQYQCVVPKEGGAARRVLDVLTHHGGASFLCVIKDCGPEGQGVLSFPKLGISIALDIAIRPETQGTVDALNACVLEEGGRIYLAKDALTRATDFQAMEPRLATFNAVRDRWDPERRLRSAQSIRLLGDPGPTVEAAPPSVSR